MNPYYSQDGITIYHGDCLEVLPTLALPSYVLLLTDPPYGDNHNGDYRRFTGGAKVARSVHSRIKNDAKEFDPRFLLDCGQEHIIWGANRFSDKFPIGSLLVWDKRSPGGNKNVMSDGEPAWWSRGRGVYIFSHPWDGFNRASERGTAYHPTQKPVALMQWCLSKARRPDLVLDPFLGSGSTLRAAANMGLPGIGIELEERSCEIAARRLAQEAMLLEV